MNPVSVKGQCFILEAHIRLIVYPKFLERVKLWAVKLAHKIKIYLSHINALDFGIIVRCQSHLSLFNQIIATLCRKGICSMDDCYSQHLSNMFYLFWFTHAILQDNRPIFCKHITCFVIADSYRWCFRSSWASRP